jgi:hypothetical protein
VKPGKQTSFVFPFAMHSGMGGPHHFEVHVKTNDPQQSDLVFDIRANAVETKK